MSSSKDNRDDGDKDIGPCLSPDLAIPVILLNRAPQTVRVERTVAAGEGDDVQAVSDETLRHLLDACRRQAGAEVQAERDRLASGARALQSACQALRRQQEQLRAEAEQQLLELALEIAGKVLAQEIQAGRYEIEPIVRAALERAGSPDGEVVVHLNADDLAGLREAQGQGEEWASVRLVADAGVGRGECVVQTAQGVVESRIDGHLGEIDQALNDGAG